MFRIGEFSRIAQVSGRLLRYYDQIGLLRPAHTQSRTGYRYYTATQLGRLHRILILRDLGFTLEQIRPIVDAEVNADELRGMLALRRAEVEQELAVQAERLRQLEYRIACLDGEAVPDDGAGEEVLFRPLPAARVLTTRTRVGSFDEGRAMAFALLAEVDAHLPRKLRGQLIAIQHAPIYEPDAIDLELGFFVEGELEAATLTIAGHALVVRELDAVDEAAICVRVGPPEQAHRPSQAIARSLESRGLQVAGPNREVFLRLPSAAAPPVIEMQFPVRPA